MEGSRRRSLGRRRPKGPRPACSRRWRRGRALEDARDELEVMDEETDEAAHFWGHLYACDSDDDEDEVDDEVRGSPEEAQRRCTWATRSTTTSATSRSTSTRS